MALHPGNRDIPSFEKGPVWGESSDDLSVTPIDLENISSPYGSFKVPEEVDVAESHFSTNDNDVFQEGEKEEIDVVNGMQMYVLNGLEFDLGISPKEIDSRILDEGEREKNKEKAKKLFYTDAHIENLIKSKEMGLSVVEQKEKIDFFYNDDVQRNLDNIMSSFVINIEGASLVEINEELGDKGSEIVGRALDYAFEWEASNLLDGKQNYNKELVDSILIEMRGGNPFEKLEWFMKLWTVLGTGEGKGGKKQGDLFRQMTEKKTSFELEKIEIFKVLKNNFREAKVEKSLELLKNTLTQVEGLKKEVKYTGIFQPGELDIFSGEVEKAIKEIQD